MLFEVKQNNDTSKKCECHKCENTATAELVLFGDSSMYLCDKCISNVIRNLADVMDKSPQYFACDKCGSRDGCSTYIANGGCWTDAQDREVPPDEVLKRINSKIGENKTLTIGSTVWQLNADSNNEFLVGSVSKLN